MRELLFELLENTGELSLEVIILRMAGKIGRAHV